MKNINFIFLERNTIQLLLNKASRNDPAFCPNGCGRSYKGPERKGNLKKHMMYACGVNPQFNCMFCSKQLRYKHSLQYHLATVHPRDMIQQ